MSSNETASLASNRLGSNENIAASNNSIDSRFSKVFDEPDSKNFREFCLDLIRYNLFSFFFNSIHDFFKNKYINNLNIF
jgi:hypothetical protein